jgi:hypothetical protein
MFERWKGAFMGWALRLKSGLRSSRGYVLVLITALLPLIFLTLVFVNRTMERSAILAKNAYNNFLLHGPDWIDFSQEVTSPPSIFGVLLAFFGLAIIPTSPIIPLPATTRPIPRKARLPPPYFIPNRIALH